MCAPSDRPLGDAAEPHWDANFDQKLNHTHYCFLLKTHPYKVVKRGGEDELKATDLLSILDGLQQFGLLAVKQTPPAA